MSTFYTGSLRHANCRVERGEFARKGVVALQAPALGVANTPTDGVSILNKEMRKMPPRGRLVVDVRSLDSAVRRPILFSLVDKLVELGTTDQLLLITDHEPSGIGYQIDLRKQTRGMFEFSYDQRSDGAWVAFIRPRKR
jgi:uncharacterized protein (DUF2249 family)